MFLVVYYGLDFKMNTILCYFGYIFFIPVPHPQSSVLLLTDVESSCRVSVDGDQYRGVQRGNITNGTTSKCLPHSAIPPQLSLSRDDELAQSKVRY